MERFGEEIVVVINTDLPDAECRHTVNNTDHLNEQAAEDRNQVARATWQRSWAADFSDDFMDERQQPTQQERDDMFD